ncbi:MAG TPA: uridine kinase [Pseudonocardia sp.]|nr:uridine kinase [Pseudonocardia sp.]
MITPISADRLVDRITELVVGRPGRVRLAVDGAPPTRPVALAERVVAELRTRGRAGLVVAAADFLRPASVRLEYGREDPDEFLDGWLDETGLRREVLDPAGPDGTGRVLPRLWNSAADRAFRERYTQLPDNGITVLAGALLLGRGLPLELSVHLRMSGAALARNLPEAEHWTLAAYARYDLERQPADHADLLVLADHPDRPAVQLGG